MLMSHDVQFSCLCTCNSHLSGSGCSKLTMSLVNVSLKFQILISQICQYFCGKNVRSFCSAKASLIELLSFFQQKISVYLVVKL